MILKKIGSFTFFMIMALGAIAQMPAKGDNAVIVHGVAPMYVENAFLRNGYTLDSKFKSSHSDAEVVRLRYNRAIRSGYIDIEEVFDANGVMCVKVHGMDAAFSTIAYRWGEKGQFLEFADIAARCGSQISYTHEKL